MRRRAIRLVVLPATAAGLWFAGLGGGLLGGSAIGVLEAGWVLSSTAPSEYQAVFYGAVIYGLIGAVLGAGIGFLNALLGRLGGLGLGLAWCLGFFGAAGTLALVILRFVLNQRWYGESGVPGATTFGIAAGLALLGIVGVWFGRNVLTKTPLRVLARPKGTFTLWVACTALAAVVSVAPAPAAQGAMVPHHPQDGTAARPNIVLVQIDALRYDALGIYNGDPKASPNLDAFARDAVVFDQDIAAASWTRASTASLLTSAPPSSHGCVGKDGVLASENVTLAEALASANYAAGGFPNNANITAALGFGQGFDWYPYTPEYPLGATESTYSLTMYSVARRLYARLQPHRRVEDYYMPAETQLARAEDWVHAQGEDRWFTFVHLMEPHDPWFSHPITGEAYGRAEHPSPDPALEPQLRALYAGEVRHADEQLGGFLERLRAADLYDDALIIVTSDHGEELHDHGGWWHGATLFDEQIHVPLIIKLPRNERAGTRVPWQVREIDIPATILGIAGVEPEPDSWDGENVFTDDFDQQLAVTLPPEPDPEVPQGALPAWTPPHWWQLPASREALSEENFEGYRITSLRAEGKKIVQTSRVPEGSTRPLGETFYDLTTDPREQTPAPDDPAIEGLRLRLQTAEDRAREDSRVPSQVGPSPSETDLARLRQLGYAAPE